MGHCALFLQKKIRDEHKEWLDTLRKDKYWLYKAQFEEEQNIIRQFGKVRSSLVLNETQLCCG